MNHPVGSVGLVMRGNAPNGAFAGTCFAFRHPQYFLTAAHCVTDLDPSEARIALILHPSVDFISVLKIHRHPSADIAVLAVDLPNTVDVPAFWNAVSNYHYGEDVQAFGFPEDVFGATSRAPTARMFKGHIQRTLEHTSHLGFRYEAAELNFGAPGGLSGGPVFRPAAPVMIIGLVTENLQSTTLLEAAEEMEVNGTLTRNRYQTVINYGVALLLHRVDDWLTSIIPTRGSVALE